MSNIKNTSENQAQSVPATTSSSADSGTQTTGSTSVTSDGTRLGTPNDDDLSGEGRGFERIKGEAGNDELRGGGGGRVFLNGGLGDDKLYGDGGGSLILEGDAGDDELRGGGSSELDGGDGDDKLYSDGGNSTLKGGSGNDELYNTGGGLNTLAGGEGDDKLYFADSSGGNTVEFAKGDGQDTIYGVGKYGLAGLSKIYFTGGIRAEDLMLRFRGDDLWIGLKEPGNSPESITQLSDVIHLVGGRDHYRAGRLVLELTSTDGTTATVIGSAADLFPSVEDENVAGVSPPEAITPESIAPAPTAPTKNTPENPQISESPNTRLESPSAGITLVGSPDHAYVTYLGGSGGTITGNSSWTISQGGNGNTINGDTGWMVDEGGSGNRLIGGPVTTWVTSHGGSGNTLTGGIGDNWVVVYGGGENTLDGGLGDDRLVVRGGAENTLIGGKGHDTLFLRGGGGNNIVKFAQGDGRDVIVYDSSNEVYRGTGSGLLFDTLIAGSPLNPNNLHFLGTIRAEDLLLQFKGNDLWIGLRNSKFAAESITDLEDSPLQDVIRLADWRLPARAGWSIGTLSFADGSDSLDLLSLLELAKRDDWNPSSPVINLAAPSDIVASAIRYFPAEPIPAETPPEDPNAEAAYVLDFGSGRSVITQDDLAFSSVAEGDEVTDRSKNTLRFGESVNVSDVIFQRFGDDLFIALRPNDVSLDVLNGAEAKLENTDQVVDMVRLRGWGGNPSQLRVLEFGGGQVRLNVENLIELVGVGDENPIVDFDGEAGVQVGNVNDDTLLSDNNINILFGYGGADELRGSFYNDHFWGGAGDDQLFGHTGDDTYWFNLGDGHDTITEFNIGRDQVDNNDRVVFGEGIGRENLWLGREGDDLVIDVIGRDGERVTVAKHFDASNNGRVERLELADGSHLGWANFNSLIDAMARFDAPGDGLLTLSDSDRSSVRDAISETWVTGSTA